MIDYVGYHAEQKTYILGELAYQSGKQYSINKEDYFELPRHTNLKCNAPFALEINKNQEEYQQGWVKDLIDAYGVKGLIGLTAFLVGYMRSRSVRLTNHFHSWN